jgi:cytochrome P450
VLFGEDMNAVITQEVTYLGENYQEIKMEFRNFLIKHFKDLADCYVHPLTIIFPWANKYNLCEPFKRIMKNNQTMRRILKEAMDKSKDVNSIYHQIKQTPGVDEKYILDDLVIIILGGTETTSHSIISTLFFLKKNPRCLENLMKELEENGFWEKDSFKKYTLDNIHKLDYLSYVVKEVLRYDNPATETIRYATKEDVEICGVPISKNEILCIEILIPQFNPSEWQKPLEFIPERFDPESEYFSKPGGDNKPRSPFSYIPFSHGARKCPGMIFATLEFKVALIYILTHFKYEIPQESLNNPGPGFGIATNLTLDMIITDSKKE